MGEGGRGEGSLGGWVVGGEGGRGKCSLGRWVRVGGEVVRVVRVGRQWVGG